MREMMVGVVVGGALEPACLLESMDSTTVKTFSKETVESVGDILNDTNKSLSERFRALFTLRGIASHEAIGEIGRCFNDPSALLKHECAYCLGQIQDPYAIPMLRDVLEDTAQEPMVRHEAAEALGAIGDPSIAELLEKYSSDPSREVAETCQISLDRIRWLPTRDEESFVDNNPYNSVDPAPPLMSGSIPEWRHQLTDSALPLFLRYRAMFALRNCGGREAVLALVSGFADSSALFKHEIAYILGQMQNESAVDGLRERLDDLGENAMVRHECAEALGSIATEECLKILQRYQRDGERVVRESCEVALDMYKHEKSGAFQYANTASQINQQLNAHK